MSEETVLLTEPKKPTHAIAMGSRCVIFADKEPLYAFESGGTLEVCALGFKPEVFFGENRRNITITKYTHEEVGEYPFTDLRSVIEVNARLMVICVHLSNSMNPMKAIEVRKREALTANGLLVDEKVCEVVGRVNLLAPENAHEVLFDVYPKGSRVRSVIESIYMRYSVPEGKA